MGVAAVGLLGIAGWVVVSSSSRGSGEQRGAAGETRGVAPGTPSEGENRDRVRVVRAHFVKQIEYSNDPREAGRATVSRDDSRFLVLETVVPARLLGVPTDGGTMGVFRGAPWHSIRLLDAAGKPVKVASGSDADSARSPRGRHVFHTDTVATSQGRRTRTEEVWLDDGSSEEELSLLFGPVAAGLAVSLQWDREPPTPLPAATEAEVAPRLVPAWAHVSPLQIEAAARLKLAVAFADGDGLRFVLIPPGSFRMGSPASEPGRQDDETAHDVTLSAPFYMQVTQMSRRDLRKFLPQHAAPPAGAALDDMEPAIDVDHDVAERIFNGRNSGSGHLVYALPTDQDGRRDVVYGLPTEAQWEYAARAGTVTASWSQVPLGYAPGGAEATAHNPWGLVGMESGPREWCADGYAPYPEGSGTDPRREVQGLGHVIRGGRSADRDHAVSHQSDVGFRLAVMLR